MKAKQLLLSLTLALGGLVIWLGSLAPGSATPSAAAASLEPVTCSGLAAGCRLTEPAIGAASGLKAPLRQTGVVTSIGAFKDNTIYQNQGDLSNGAGRYIIVGRTNQPPGQNPVRRGLIRFEITASSPVPAGSTIISASLRLHVDRVPSGFVPNLVSLHQVLTGTWGAAGSNAFVPGPNPGEEGEGSGAQAQTNDATWTHRRYTSTTWTTPGGDFAGTASASTMITGTGFFIWSSPQMVSDVQQWFTANVFEDPGWLLKGDETTAKTAIAFASSNNPIGEAANRPLLLIEYIPPGPALTLAKSASDSTPVPGQRITYTIVVTNIGTQPATGGRIADTLPAGTTFAGPISLNPPGAGTVGSVPSLVTGLTIANGASVTVTLPVTINSNQTAGTIITNTATVTSAEIATPVSGLVAVVVDAPLPPVLALTKSVNDLTPFAGQRITYTIVVSNTGLGPATGGRISDTLPTGVTFAGPISLNPGGAGTIGSIPGLVNNLTIAAGGKVTVTLPVTVNGNVAVGTFITNTASVTSSEIVTPTFSSVTVEIDPPPAPQLVLEKRISDSTPEPGQFITYTIIVTNTGDATATGGGILDTLPSIVTFIGPISLTTSGAGSPGDGTTLPVLASGLSLAPGNSLTLTVPVQVTDSAVIGTFFSNTATTVNLGGNFPATADSVNAIVTAPPLVRLEINKQVNNLRPQPGETLSFTITVKNTSQVSLFDIQIFDPMPAGLFYEFGSEALEPPSAFGFIGSPPFMGTGLDLNINETLTLTFRAQVDPNLAPGTPFTNTATASTFFFGFFQVDSSVGLAVAQPGLALTKQVNNPNPLAGQTINYTIRVTNTGNTDALDMVISDTLPAGISPVGSVILDPLGLGTIGTPPTLAAVPTLAPGAALTITLPANVQSGLAPGTVITNTAAATSTDISTPVTDEVTLTVAIPPVSGLALQKSVSKPNPQLGETFTYTLVVVNIGQVAATNVRISDTLPSGINLVGPIIQTPPGTPLPPPAGSTLATIASIASSDRVTLTVPVRVIPGVAVGTILTNTAAVTSTEVVSPATSAVPITVEPSPFPALSLSKQVNDILPQAGEIITYTVFVANIGQVNLTNVRISDTLPAGLTFVGPVRLDPPGTTLPPPSLPTLASNLTLNTGQSLTLTFPMMVNSGVASGTQITNRASVTSTQVITPATGQVILQVINLSPPTTTLFLPLILKTQTLLPDLIGSFTLTPNKNSFAAGEPVQITAVITNVGGARADSFWVDFYINPSTPPGVNVPWNSTCSLSPCTGIAWFVSGGLNPGQSITLTSTPDSYEAGQTIWPGSFNAGTSNLHLFVDSWNPTVAAGAVFESNEANNHTQLSGLTVSGLAPAGIELPDAGELPSRPEIR